MDIHPRQENLITKGEPVLLQLPLVPAYACHRSNLARAALRSARVFFGFIAPRLTVHKTQALSIKHVVKGCLEAAGRIVERMLEIVRRSGPIRACSLGVKSTS